VKDIQGAKWWGRLELVLEVALFAQFLVVAYVAGQARLELLGFVVALAISLGAAAVFARRQWRKYSAWAEGGGSF
jgi:hypothetical protein